MSYFTELLLKISDNDESNTIDFINSEIYKYLDYKSLMNLSFSKYDKKLSYAIRIQLKMPVKKRHMIICDDEMKDKIYEECEYVKKLGNMKGVIIAGGFVCIGISKHLQYKDYKKSDIDIFVTKEGTLQKLTKYFDKKKATYKQIGGVCNVYLPNYDRHFQIILTGHKNVYDCISQFHFSNVKCGITKGKLVITPDCQFTIKNMNNTLSTYTHTSAYLLRKARERGFNVIGYENANIGENAETMYESIKQHKINEDNEKTNEPITSKQIKLTPIQHNSNYEHMSNKNEFGIDIMDDKYIEIGHIHGHIKNNILNKINENDKCDEWYANHVFPVESMVIIKLDTIIPVFYTYAFNEIESEKIQFKSVTKNNLHYANIIEDESELIKLDRYNKKLKKLCANNGWEYNVQFHTSIKKCNKLIETSNYRQIKKYTSIPMLCNNKIINGIKRRYLYHTDCDTNNIKIIKENDMCVEYTTFIMKSYAYIVDKIIFS